jgi:hypothetical protein
MEIMYRYPLKKITALQANAASKMLEQSDTFYELIEWLENNIAGYTWQWTDTGTTRKAYSIHYGNSGRYDAFAVHQLLVDIPDTYDAIMFHLAWGEYQ